MRPSPPPPAPTASSPEEWYHQKTTEILTQFRTAPAGLTSAEAARRLERDGPNTLKPAARISAWQLLLTQFNSLVIWVLFAAAMVSFGLGATVEGIAILAVVALNGLIGFHQEWKAAQSIATLQQLTAPQAKVWREGRLQLLPASTIVKGDILALEAGDLIAADARLLHAAVLSCIESALTGESETVAKNTAPLRESGVAVADQTNMVFMGTSVATGTGRAVVVATAMQTSLGQIAGLLEEAGATGPTPLEKKLEAFGRVLVKAALGMVLLLFGLGLLRGTPWLELFMTSVSLAVAAVPEGLPAIVTVALAVGVTRMSGHRALVRRLSSVETLGSTTVICTDKTGTLTMGQMTVQQLYVPGQHYLVSGMGYSPAGTVTPDPAAAFPPSSAPLEALATALIACNNASLTEKDGIWNVIGDPTEGALLAAALKTGAQRSALESRMPRAAEFPFDADRKRSSILRRLPDGSFRAFCNGAPGPLLACCTHHFTATGVQPLTASGRKAILKEADRMADAALRVLASATSLSDYLPGTLTDQLTTAAVESHLVFNGLSGMHDPPRPEASAAIAQCRAAGIRAVMITGDHPNTAAAIAGEIGLNPEKLSTVSGTDLDHMDEATLRQRIPGIAVFARVTAGHKLRIIRAWQANGAIVAMTGDGVNDAPAIKAADIGIAMGQGGTEVTRQAADMVITDDHFATIVTAVEAGRGIYDNIRKTLQYLLAGSTAELLIMVVCVIIGLPTPLLPIHLLWINLITDGLPALCLATDAVDSDVMKRSPRPPLAGFTDRRFLRTMLLTGTITAAVTLAVFYWHLHSLHPETARTSAFTVLVFAELLRAFGARSATKPIWRIPLLTNWKLLLVVALSFTLQMISLSDNFLAHFLKTTPMPLTDGLILIALGAIPLAFLEILKRPTSPRPSPTAPGVFTP